MPAKAEEALTGIIPAGRITIETERKSLTEETNLKEAKAVSAVLSILTEEITIEKEVVNAALLAEIAGKVGKENHLARTEERIAAATGVLLTVIDRGAMTATESHLVPAETKAQTAVRLGTGRNKAIAVKTAE